MSAIGAVMAAESPFIGKWKVNPAKSQFAGTTATYELLPSGEMQFTGDGQSYRLRMEADRSNTWETVGKMGGMVNTQTTKLSAWGG